MPVFIVSAMYWLGAGVIMEGSIEDKVLIIDDEPANVAALMDYFDRCGLGYDFSQTLVGAAHKLYDAHTSGTPYALVISDNHFKEDVGGFSNFNGIDLVRILVGAELDDEQRLFAEDYFGSSYGSIADHYSDRVIMFSGSAHSEPEAEGLPVVQKFPDEDGVCCEAGVVDIMESRGFSFDESAYSIREYKVKNGLCSGGAGDVCDAHEASVRAFLKEHMSLEEAAEYFE